MTDFDHPPFQMRPETQQLIDCLRLLKRGQRISYGEAATQIGVPESDLAKGRFWETARRHLLNDHRIVVVRRDGGYVRLGDGAIAENATDQITRQHRKSRGELNKLSVVEVENLKPDQRASWNYVTTHHGVLANMTAPKARKQLQAKVQNAQQRLPLDATLTVFLSDERKHEG